MTRCFFGLALLHWLMNTYVCLCVCEHLSGKEYHLSIDHCQHSRQSKMFTKTQIQKARWQSCDPWAPQYIRSFKYAKYGLSAINSLKLLSTSLQSLQNHIAKSLSPLQNTILTSSCTRLLTQNHLCPRIPSNLLSTCAKKDGLSTRTATTSTL